MDNKNQSYEIGNTYEENSEMLSNINTLKIRLNSEHNFEGFKKILNSISDLQLISVLRETDANIDKSMRLLNEYIDFRLEIQSDWYINRINVLDIIQSNMLFWHKYDKLKTPCLVVRIRKFIAANHTIKDLLKFIFFMIDNIYQKIHSNKEPTHKKFCLIWDRGEYEKEKNFHHDAAQLGGLYREMAVANFFHIIHKVYICNVPLIHRMMFTVAKVFIPKKYLEKLEMFGEPKNLLEYFDEDCLLKEYGGNSEINDNENHFENIY